MKSICKNEVKINTMVLTIWLFVASVFPAEAFGAKPSFMSYELKSDYKEILFDHIIGKN